MRASQAASQRGSVKSSDSVTSPLDENEKEEAERYTCAPFKVRVKMNRPPPPATAAGNELYREP